VQKVRLKDLKFEFCQFKLGVESQINLQLTGKISSSSTSAQVRFYNTFLLEIDSEKVETNRYLIKEM